MADEGPKDACKTYVEQTKLLVTLASAFVVAPVAFVPLVKAGAGPEVAPLLAKLVEAEFWFVASVVSGYFVLATIAGAQHRGQYDVHRLATRITSLLQLATYGIGLWRFTVLVKFLITVASG